MTHNKFEKARIVGARAFQLALNAHTSIRISGGFLDPVYVAYLEYKRGKTPLRVVEE